MSLKCDMCIRTSSDTYAENACCLFHRRHFLFELVNHTRHCDRRQGTVMAFVKARHLSGRGRHEA